MSRAETKSRWSETVYTQTIAKIFAKDAALAVAKRCDPERMFRMAKLRSEGYSWDAIGRDSGLSRERARQLLLQYERKLSEFLVFR